jgi:hypothetical protein
LHSDKVSSIIWSQGDISISFNEKKSGTAVLIKKKEKEKENPANSLLKLQFSKAGYFRIYLYCNIVFKLN